MSAVEKQEEPIRDAPTPSLPRGELLKSVLGHGDGVDEAIDHVLSDSGAESPHLPHNVVPRVRLANKLADMTNGNEELLRKVMPSDGSITLRAVADKYPIKLPAPNSISKRPSDSRRMPSVAPLALSREVASADDKSSHAERDVQHFQSQLFQAEPSAVLRRMVLDRQVRHNKPRRR